MCKVLVTLSFILFFTSKWDTDRLRLDFNGANYHKAKKGAPLSLQPFEGLKLQDLRKLKDMLIVETADMLQAPLFTAEALLRAHGLYLSIVS